MITLPNITTEPYAFDGAYARCFESPEVAIDRRHVFLLHDILSAWPFRNALELGSYNGASSTAFVEVINNGATMQATFCDPRVTPGLLSVVANCRRPVRVLSGLSWDVLATDDDFDFILVDACHDLDSVSRELNHLMRRRPLCVMAHDTSATATGYPACEGAALLAGTFCKDIEYFWLEDSKRRPGERTERGLFFATTDDALYAKAIDVFEKWA